MGKLSKDILYKNHILSSMEEKGKYLTTDLKRYSELFL